MTRENRTHGKFSHTSGKITRNCTTIVVDESALRSEKNPLKGYTPILDETPGQPDFKRLIRHPKIAALIRHPGNHAVCRSKKVNNDIVEKEVLVYNQRNDLCGKLVWTPSEGEKFSLIN